MKLWILKPISSDSELWSPWYDKAFGFIVRAKNETDARQLASEESGDEGPEAWLNPQYSTCEPLTNKDGVVGVVMRDFRLA